MHPIGRIALAQTGNFNNLLRSNEYRGACEMALEKRSSFLFYNLFPWPHRRVGGNLSGGLGVFETPLFDSLMVAFLMGDLRSLLETYF